MLSDLSVRPISTFLMSLVMAGWARPAWRASRRARSMTSPTPPIFALARRALTFFCSTSICGLGRVRPRRDQVHLAPVQAVVDDLRVEAAARQLVAQRLGRRRELRLLLGRRLAALEQPRPPRPHHVHLGAAREEQEQAALHLRPGAQLAVDVGHVGAADHGHVHAQGGEPLHAAAHGSGIRVPVGDGGAVPVEADDRERPLRGVGWLLHHRRIYHRAAARGDGRERDRLGGAWQTGRAAHAARTVITPASEETPVDQFDVVYVRNQFPALQRVVDGRPAAFLDAPAARRCRSACSTPCATTWSTPTPTRTAPS